MFTNVRWPILVGVRTNNNKINRNPVTGFTNLLGSISEKKFLFIINKSWSGRRVTTRKVVTRQTKVRRIFPISEREDRPVDFGNVIFYLPLRVMYIRLIKAEDKVKIVRTVRCLQTVRAASKKICESC